jgi:hypothetical protein
MAAPARQQQLAFVLGAAAPIGCGAAQASTQLGAGKMVVMDANVMSDG